MLRPPNVEFSSQGMKWNAAVGRAPLCLGLLQRELGSSPRRRG